ncbi:MAG TPA: serine protease [Chthoniobacterales bacterium]|nr:serine protease [Chthoniobacterales bacterium]
MSNQTSPERLLFDQFAPGVAYVAVEDKTGKPGIGTCFHIGENIFVTARHVVEERKITKIATTNAGIRGEEGSYSATYTAGEAKRIEGPYFHPDANYDLAALRLDGLYAPQIPFITVLEDRFENKLLLRTVVVMGFPPIPGSRSPVLVCARAEVNASFTTYFDNQRVYVVSCLARGGFSGGPALTPPHHCLGVVTRAVLKDSLPEELGFMTVVGPLPVLELLDHHKLMPRYLREELWDPYQKKKNSART